jgi:hypothetical protein
MKKINELNLITITIFQTIIAATISLFYQFIFPMTWQPLDVAMFGPNIKHGDPGRNFVIATLTQWWFSFTIAWFVYRDNPYINNFLAYSFVSMGVILFLEVVLYKLYWDYIHMIVFIVDIYIFWKKRATLFQKWLLYYLTIITIWYFSVYFLRLAYFGAPLWFIIFDYIFAVIINIAISFSFSDSISLRERLMPNIKKSQNK